MNQGSSQQTSNYDRENDRRRSDDRILWEFHGCKCLILILSMQVTWQAMGFLNMTSHFENGRLWAQIIRFRTRTISEPFDGIIPFLADRGKKKIDYNWDAKGASYHLSKKMCIIRDC